MFAFVFGLASIIAMLDRIPAWTKLVGELFR